MARPAVDRAGAWTAWLRDQLAPRPGRAAFAAKLSLICALTALATAIYRTPEPALATYLAFFLNVRDRTTSLLLDLLLTLIVALVIGLVLATAMLVLDHAAARVGAIAALSFGLLFLASASKLKPLAATIGLIVGYALDKLGEVQMGEEATRGLLYAWLFVAMPALVSIVYNLAAGRQPRRMAAQGGARGARRLPHPPPAP